MKYLIVGAGGIGGSMAGVMANAGKDVTLIMRGDSLDAVRRDGFYLSMYYDGEQLEERKVPDLKCASWEKYEESGESPDVIFLCTKAYSVESVADNINRVASDSTIIIPILNGIRMGEYTRRFVHSGRPIDGCIYMYGEKLAPGKVAFTTKFMRIVFGAEKEGTISDEEAAAIVSDLNDSGIKPTYSKNILRDTIRKFSGVGAASAAEIIHGCSAGPIWEPGPEQDTYLTAVREVEALGEALGAPSDVDLVEKSLKLIRSLGYDNYTSMLVDIRAGRRSEFDSQIGAAIRIGDSVGVDMKTFKKAADVMRESYNPVD